MKLKCLICGRSYHHLGSHIWHGHQITAREYKEEFELPYKMALISEEVYEKKRERFEEDREKYLRNLAKHGKKFQFKKGHSGLRRISQHERQIILERILKVNKTKGRLEQCPVCRMRYRHLESHLYNKHGMLKLKKPYVSKQQSIQKMPTVRHHPQRNRRTRLPDMQKRRHSEEPRTRGKSKTKGRKAWKWTDAMVQPLRKNGAHRFKKSRGRRVLQVLRRV